MRCQKCKTLPAASHTHDPFLAMWDMWFTNSPMLTYLKQPKIYAVRDSGEIMHFDFTGWQGERGEGKS